MRTFAVHLTWALSVEETTGNELTGALSLAAATFYPGHACSHSMSTGQKSGISQSTRPTSKKALSQLLTAHIFEASAAFLPDIPTAGAGPVLKKIFRELQSGSGPSTAVESLESGSREALAHIEYDTTSIQFIWLLCHLTILVLIVLPAALFIKVGIGVMLL
ncbi:hypothetical protein BT96DRAFT_947554 [Gymnopus androsaceus JB14]|uniref:Uncharacterized protein n=1 Tax=Gymnopus androsaceus JB14 TaxID=1447944 RepID=A0A6A4GTP5_9AGAR|nr:hypothetical protein BT96DRAFT_947554 [Gymnopus androsaceus JB14]